MATVIGKIYNLKGVAVVVNELGQQQLLKNGDVLLVGSTLVTSLKSSVGIKLINGETVKLTQAQTVKLTDTLVQKDVIDSTESAVNQTTMTSVLTSLNQGQSVAQGVDTINSSTTSNNMLEAPSLTVGTTPVNQPPSSPPIVNDVAATSNVQFLKPSGNTPTVLLLQDLGPNDGFISAAELNGARFVTASIGLPGNAVAGDYLNIADNNGGRVIVITEQDIAAGFVVVQVSPLPVEGATVTVTASITNQAGDTSDVFTDTAVLDTIAPNALTNYVVIDSTLPGTAVIPNNSMTNDGTPEFTGTGQLFGNTIMVNITGANGQNTVLTANVKPNGTWSVTPLNGLLEQNYVATLTVKDKAGNLSATTAPFNFTVDYEAPTRPTITSVVNDNGPVKESITSGSVTNDNTPTISGTARPGTLVEVFAEKAGVVTSLGNTTTDGTGAWRLTPATTLSDGSHSLYAVADSLGRKSTPSASFNLSIDTQAPLAPTLSDVRDDVGIAVSFIRSGDMTNDTTPTFSGKCEVGSLITILDNGKVIATIASNNWTWSFTPTPPFAEGPHSITTTATDKAGNVSPASAPFTFTVDTQAPTTPIIGNIVDDFGVQTDKLQTGAIADDATPTLTGSAEANSVVNVFDGKVNIGSVVADKNGQWSFTPAANIAAGKHVFSVTATDAAGNTSASSTPFEYTLNQAPIFAVKDATVDVSEDGLANGLLDAGISNIVASGTLGISDTNNDIQAVTLTAPTTPYSSSGVALTWAGSNTSTLIGSANGKEIIRVTIDNAGSYQVRLSGPIDHPQAGEDNLALNIGVTARDSAVSTSGSITVNIQDDAPTAVNQQISQAVQATLGERVNVMLTLDTSGSIAIVDGIAGTTRLQTSISAINTLLDRYVAEGSDVRVMLVTFGGVAVQKTNTWVTVAQAKLAMTGLTTTSSTNYDDALAKTRTAFTAAGKLTDAKNVGYFFSDAEPYPTTSGIDNNERLSWEAFLNANAINQYAIGVGSGRTEAQIKANMDQIAYNGADGVDTFATRLTTYTQLNGLVTQTPQPPVTGSLGNFGADGGYVKSITVDGSTYSYDAKTGALSVTGINNGFFANSTKQLSIKTAEGVFAVNMNNGEYRFTPVQANQELVRFLDPVSSGSDYLIGLPTGWFTNNASGKLEVMPSNVFGLAKDYGDVLELEAAIGDNSLYTLVNSAINQKITLNFDYAARAGWTAPNDSAIQVLVDGKLIATLDTLSTTMTNFNYTFNGTGNQMRIEFKSVNANGAGGLLDNIKVLADVQAPQDIIRTLDPVGNGSGFIPVPTGWFTNNTNGMLEVHHSSVYGLAKDYGYVLEIEARIGDSSLYTLVNSAVNQKISLNFDYAARAGWTAPNESAIQVLVDGKLVDTVDTRSTTMTNFNYTFNGTGNQMRIEFKSVNANGGGGLLDNIKVSAETKVAPKTKVDFVLADNDGDTASASLNFGNTGNGQANLIVNGSFEDVTGLSSAPWGYVGKAAIAGWTDTNGLNIEVVNTARTSINATDGKNWLDLEATVGNNRIGQNVQNVAKGQAYVLKFSAGDYVNADDNTASDNTVTVYWGGQAIATLNPKDGVMTEYSYNVIGGAGNGNNRLEFESGGRVDGYGVGIDKVSLIRAVETPNLIVNGSFEDVTGLSATSWGFAGASMVGWTSTRSLDFEVVNKVYNGLVATDGTNTLDMEATVGNNRVGQNVQNVAKGELYALSFSAGDLVSAQDNTLNDNTISLYWGGWLMATINPKDGVMSDYQFSLVGGFGNGNNRLEFESGGFVDGHGVSLDNVVLTKSVVNYNVVNGDANANTLNGSSGNDLITGMEGNDNMSAYAGQDTLIGGKGNDTMFGGTGADVFKWSLGDGGAPALPARDVIGDFDKAAISLGGDVLDVRDVLQGETSANIACYLNFQKSGTDTLVSMSAHGGYVNGAYSLAATTQQVVLTGVDMVTGQGTNAQIINSLLAQQKLIID